MDTVDSSSIHAFFSSIPVWAGLAWMAFVVLGSLLFRLTRGKPVFANPPAKSVFLERWRSGRNRSTFFGRFGGANNCLMVAVGEGRLRLLPHFPFTLMFLPEVFGLEVDVPLSKVRSARIEKGWVIETLCLELDDAGTPRRFELHLKNPRDFFHALGLDHSSGT